MIQISVVTILVMFMWLIVIEFKSDMYFVLIMKHQLYTLFIILSQKILFPFFAPMSPHGRDSGIHFLGNLPRLKRYVIRFKIELEIEFLSDPEWSTGRPTSLLARDYEALFLFYLIYHISLAFSLRNLV